MSRQATDQILLQARLHPFKPDSFAHACAAAALAWPGAEVRRMACSTAGDDAYGYLTLPRRFQLDASDLAAVEVAFSQALPGNALARVSRLELALNVPGASHGAEPAFHYVVEMDPETGWREELMRWYDMEHLPGLASVTGNIQATRMLNHDHGPLSLACYDLVGPDVLGSPPWLAVRGTDWSSRVRPHFTHTRRTMFSVLRASSVS